MLVQSLVESAHGAWPRLSLVEELPERGEQAPVARLDGVAIDGHGHVHPAEDDHDLRVLGLGQVVVSVGRDGRPISFAKPTADGTPAIAINGGTLTACFTPQRLVGAFLSGQLGGAQTLARRSALAFELPWSEVRRLTLVTRAPGGRGEEALVGLAVQGPDHRPGPGALVFEPGNWISLPERATVPIEDVGTVVEEVTRLVAVAHGLDALPEYRLDEDGMLAVEFDD